MLRRLPVSSSYIAASAQHKWTAQIIFTCSHSAIALKGEQIWNSFQLLLFSSADQLSFLFSFLKHFNLRFFLFASLSSTAWMLIWVHQHCVCIFLFFSCSFVVECNGIVFSPLKPMGFISKQLFWSCFFTAAIAVVVVASSPCYYFILFVC